MKKLVSIAAATVAVVPALAFSTPALAAVGQIEQGNVYRVKNVTLNGDGNGNFADSVAAQCGQTVAFRVMVHNTGPDAITNVKVAATLDSSSTTSHSSQVSITADNAHDMTVTDTATVTTDQATTISYVSGSTELLDVNGGKLSTLPDGVTAGGINIGTVGPLTSDTRDVQFEAKLNCETPQPKQIQVCELATKKVITINENDFNSNTQSKDLTKCNATPAATVLPNTGAGNVVGIVGGAIVAGFVASRLFLSRKVSR